LDRPIPTPDPKPHPNRHPNRLNRPTRLSRCSQKPADTRRVDHEARVPADLIDDLIDAASRLRDRPRDLPNQRPLFPEK